MRNGRKGQNERLAALHAAQELAERYTHDGTLRTEPPHRFLIAAILSFTVLVLGLASGGCTVGQTRFALGATLVADAATTQSAISSGAGSEGNPVLQKAPVPIMLVLSGIVAYIAEKHVKNGEMSKAKTLYTIASVVHGAAAIWNGAQGGKSGGATSAAAARPPVLTTGIASGTGRPGIRLGL